MTNQRSRDASAPRNPTPPARRTSPFPPPSALARPSPFPPPSGMDLGGESEGDEEISQEKGTKNQTPRAQWNHQKIVYLIGLLKDHDVPRFRTNNSWSKEAWRIITVQFNQKISTSYTMGQVKQKEQDMKKEYRVVKDLSGESGFGWDSDRKMVTAPYAVWESLGNRRNKDALLRWRDKSFPYFDDLFALYDGRYAEGRSCRGMDHYANKAKPSAEVEGSYSPPFHVPDLQLDSPSLSTLPSTCASALNFEIEEGGDRDDTNWFGTDELSPFSNQANDPTLPESSERAQALHPAPNEQPLVRDNISENLCMNSKPSSATPQVPDKKRLKRQKTSTDDFHDRYLMLKREEIDRFAAIEEKKMEDPYSIKNYVTTLEGMAGLLQIEDIVKAADIFRDNPANRELFLSFSSDALRVGWLLRQI